MDEAEGLTAVVLVAAEAALLAAEAWDCEEVIELAAEDVVPLVVGCGTAAVDAEGGGGERLEVEALC